MPIVDGDECRRCQGVSFIRLLQYWMASFFSCFACGGDNNNSTTAPIPISPSKIMPKEVEVSKLNVSQELEDNKSRSATNTTFMTTDSFPVSSEDDESYIRKKIEQIRKKDLPERKAMESEFIRQNLSKSAVVYLVQKQWSELYTTFLKNIEVKELRPINNSRLLDGKNNLRVDLREKDDYFIINDRVWRFVQQMYGGGPPLVQDLYFPILSLSNRKVQLTMVPVPNPLNLCFMIAILQSLLSSQHLVHYFLKKLYDDSKKKMICHSILNKIVKSNAEGASKIQIKELAGLFESRFNPCEQHDAHEFFIHLCNMLQEEGKSEITEKSITAKSPEEAYTHYFKQNRSIVDRVFVGQTETVVDCTRCSTKSVTYNAFLDLQLEIFDLSLESCLRRHFESEKIEDYECQKCSKKTKAFKKESITKTPNYLVLNLKKFTQNGRKIEDRVKYPLELSMRQFSRGHCGDTRYVLQTVLVHKGSKATKGHYYCYTHRTKKSWYYASDDLIKEIEQNQVLGRDAYMLFYERAK